MTGLRALQRVVASSLCCLALVLAASPAVSAQALTAAGASAGVPQPIIDAARGGNCVEVPAVMRRDHPDLLRHQRDLTLREGIRTPRHSLKECVTCHANAKTGSVLGASGFCQSCHDYASVRIDCFGCHSAKPKLAYGAQS